MILRNNLTIKEATLEDIPLLITLLQQLFCIEKDFEFNPKKHQQGLELIINDEKSKLFIAQFEEELIAMVSLQTLISSVAGAKSGLIEDFVVHEDFKNLGVGTHLFEHLKSFALAHKFERLQLVCDANNNHAQEFYTKKEFKKSNLLAWYLSLE